MKLLRTASAAAAAAMLLGTTFVAEPAMAQGNRPGGCTQEVAGGPAGGGTNANRSERQNSQANLASVIGLAVQNVAAPIQVAQLANLSGTGVQAVCLNDVLNGNDVRILQDILNESPILNNNLNDAEFLNILNNSLNGAQIANNVQVVAVNLGTGQVFLLGQ